MLDSRERACRPRPTITGTHNVDLMPTPRVPVVVYVVIPDLAAADLRTALDVASDVLAMASIDVLWTVCGPGECLTPDPAALKIRIMQSARAGRLSPRLCLGDALIDRRTRRGVLATAFVDRTRRLAGDLRIDHTVLLGHTIAHELGHLLLATTAHAKSGLMRDAWSRQELTSARRADWAFAPSDIALIHERLALGLG